MSGFWSLFEVLKDSLPIHLERSDSIIRLYFKFFINHLEGTTTYGLYGFSEKKREG